MNDGSSGGGGGGGGLGRITRRGYDLIPRVLETTSPASGKAPRLDGVRSGGGEGLGEGAGRGGIYYTDMSCWFTAVLLFVFVCWCVCSSLPAVDILQVNIFPPPRSFP